MYFVPKKIDLHPDGKNFLITFPYNQDTVQRVKAFSGKKWNSELKVWIVPILKDNIDLVDNEFLDFKLTKSADDAIIKYLKTYKVLKKEREEKEKLSRATTADIVIPGLKGELFPFQKAGIKFIDENGGRALVADEMGLGKTIQALGWLQYRQKLPALVVCPATLKLNWEREVQKWTEFDPYVVFSNTFSISRFMEAEVVVINYDILKNLCNEIRDKKNKVIGYTPSDFVLKKKFNSLIGDEIHLCKNARTQRTMSLLSLGEKMKHIIVLSGTPFLNRPIEIFTTLRLLKPEEYNDRTFFKFAKEYCDAKQGDYGWDFTGSSNTDELAHILRSSVMIRREKKDVLVELPEKVRVVLPESVDLKEYHRVEEDLLGWMIENNKVTLEELLEDEELEKKKNNPLAKIEYLKQIAVKAKFKSFSEWCKDFLEGSDEKLIIFGHHHEYTKKLREELKEYHPVMITGEEDAFERQKSVDLFQDVKKHRVAICGLKSANYGITLTAASNVAFLEFGWTPAEHAQAEDRAHRITQKNAVVCYYMIAIGTIEEQIYSLLEAKHKVFKEVMADKGDIKIKKEANWRAEGSIFGELIRAIKSKRLEKTKNGLKKGSQKEQVAHH